MKFDSTLKELARKLALINAAKHNGKAQVGAVVGGIIAEMPELKNRIEELFPLARTAVQDVNKLRLHEQRQIIEKRWPETLVRRLEEKKRLPPLKNVDTYERVVTRFAPNPDCVLHLGSARAIVLCYEYSRLYKGKFILRFEDTDPRTKNAMLEFYDLIREDLDWLSCKPDEEYIQSDRMPIYYEYAEKLLEQNHAYVCTCQPELFKEKVLASQPCDCRNAPIEEQIARWRRMHDGGYEEGEAVLRVKTDLNHPNPAVRDWPAARVIDSEKFIHPRVGSKYRVWPLYNLACGVDDHLMDITHIIRGKEHLTNQIRQEYMYDYMGWKYPETIHYGRLKITGTTLSKTKIIQGMREGSYTNWDDPRLATFLALKRRGISPEAIRKMIVDIGPKAQDVVLSWENLYAYNRKIIDPTADRYFFVQNPIELTVKNIPRGFTAKLGFHPDHPERGSREYRIEPGKNHEANFWVCSKDIDKSKVGKIIRLMELFNIVVENSTIYAAEARFLSETYEEAKKVQAQLIHWIPIGEDMPCQVTMPDACVIEGVAERKCRQVKTNTIIQFERFGFVRVDRQNQKLIAYYSQR